MSVFLTFEAPTPQNDQIHSNNFVGFELKGLTRGRLLQNVCHLKLAR